MSRLIEHTFYVYKAVEAHPERMVVGDIQPDTPAQTPEPLRISLLVQPGTVLIAEYELRLDPVLFVKPSNRLKDILNGIRDRKIPSTFGMASLINPAESYSPSGLRHLSGIALTSQIHLLWLKTTALLPYKTDKGTKSDLQIMLPHICLNEIVNPDFSCIIGYIRLQAAKAFLFWNIIDVQYSM